jgi:hypothetical protein
MGIESNEIINLVVFSQGHKYFFSLSLSFEILKPTLAKGPGSNFLGTI